MIIAVTGSRFATERLHRPRIRTVIGWLHGDHEITALFEGEASGVDLIARSVAEEFGIPVIPFPADWSAPCTELCKPGHRTSRAWSGDEDTFCPAAGNYRNQRMIDALRAAEGATPPSAATVLAFPVIGNPRARNRGTNDCRDRAVAAGIPTLIFPLAV